MIFLKKTLAVCMIGFGLRSITGSSTSGSWLGIWNWDNFTNIGANLAMPLVTKNEG